MSTTETDPQPLAADEPAKGKKAKKERTPSPPKDPGDFGVAAQSFVVKNYKIPAELPNEKSGLREIIKKSGLFPHKAANYITVKELRLALKGEFPFESSASYELPARTVKSLPELLTFASERARASTEMEKARSAERTALRNESLGELATKFKGTDKDARIGMIRALLGDGTWTVLNPAVGAIRSDGRFYDIDGRAGRKSYFEIIRTTDLKKDGGAKAGAKLLKVSPQVYNELIKDDAELQARIQAPADFLVTPKREAKPPKAEGEAKPKRQSKKQATGDLLAQATADADEAVAAEPAETLEEAVAAPAPVGAADLDIPEL